MGSVVVTWNVAGRVRGVPEQAAALAQRPADVVALQEIRATALPAWRAALTELGFEHLAVSEAPGGSAERRLGVLIAARAPLQPLPSPPLPWPERHVSALVQGVGEVHSLHAPISSKAGLAKVLTLEAMAAHLAAPRDHAVIVGGDFNTPRYESREGEVQSFARTRSGRIREHLGERHDAAELGIVVGLLDHGYVDAFRVLHGYERRDRSWRYPHDRTGYRLDHLLVRGARVEACDYEHGWREARLSDHSGMWARVRRWTNLPIVGQNCTPRGPERLG